MSTPPNFEDDKCYIGQDAEIRIQDDKVIIGCSRLQGPSASCLGYLHHTI
jgi:hypothetical protein